MSLATLFLALFLILFGVSALGWVAISATVLGIVALIAGVLQVIPAITIPTQRRQQ